MISKLKARQQQTRQTAIAAQIRQVEQQRSKSVSQGTITGYDADTGGYRVATQGGRSIVVRSLTSGAIATGKAVNFYSARISSRATITDVPQ